jgi:hypothetical protein
MAVSDINKSNAVDELQISLERILALIAAAGQDPESYRGLNKARNIAKNHDPGGFQAIVRQLDGDFRMIYDSMVCGEELQREMERAYSLATRL